MKKRKKRTYNVRLIKCHISYTLQEIADLYGTHINTVRQWIREGLKVIDNCKPFYVHSSDLITFLKARQSSRKQKCNFNEFYCCKCHVPRKAWENAVDLVPINEKTLLIEGLCEVCATPLRRLGTTAKVEEYKRTFHVLMQHEEHIIDRNDSRVNCHL
jgi:hypothetical protein